MMGLASPGASRPSLPPPPRRRARRPRRWPPWASTSSTSRSASRTSRLPTSSGGRACGRSRRAGRKYTDVAGEACPARRHRGQVPARAGRAASSAERHRHRRGEAGRLQRLPGPLRGGRRRRAVFPVLGVVPRDGAPDGGEAGLRADDARIRTGAPRPRLSTPGPRAPMRGLILNSPNNPTGAVVDSEELDAHRRLVRGADAWLIYDETYDRFLYDGRPHASAAALQVAVRAHRRHRRGLQDLRHDGLAAGLGGRAPGADRRHDLVPEPHDFQRVVHLAGRRPRGPDGPGRLPGVGGRHAVALRDPPEADGRRSRERAGRALPAAGGSLLRVSPTSPPCTPARAPRAPRTSATSSWPRPTWPRCRATPSETTPACDSPSPPGATASAKGSSGSRPGPRPRRSVSPVSAEGPQIAARAEATVTRARETRARRARGSRKPM